MNEDLHLELSNPQDNPEWNVQKIGKFTSSEVYKLMGSGRSKDKVFGDTAMSYIMEKAVERLTGLPASNFNGNDATEWGSNYEDYAVREFEKKTGLQTSTAAFVTASSFYGGSIDRYVGKNAILEVKCPYNSANFLKAVVNGIKSNKQYWYQNQSNLMITGRELCYHATYDPRMPEGKRLWIEEVLPDKSEFELIKERVKLANEECNRIVELLG